MRSKSALTTAHAGELLKYGYSQCITQALYSTESLETYYAAGASRSGLNILEQYRYRT